MKDKVQAAETELREKFTHMLTQISVFSNLKLDNGSTTQQQHKSSNSNGDSNGTTNTTTADLDAWMGRVTGELKKKLDVYESLLGTLRGQLQDKREKELMSVGGGGAGNLSSSSAKSSAKFMSEANGGGAEKKNGRNTPTNTTTTSDPPAESNGSNGNAAAAANAEVVAST